MIRKQIIKTTTKKDNKRQFNSLWNFKRRRHQHTLWPPVMELVVSARTWRKRPAREHTGLSTLQSTGTANRATQWPVATFNRETRRKNLVQEPIVPKKFLVTNRCLLVSHLAWDTRSTSRQSSIRTLLTTSRILISTLYYQKYKIKILITYVLFLSNARMHSKIHNVGWIQIFACRHVWYLTFYICFF